MLKLYAWPTPNGRKVTILLEELGVPYEFVPVNIRNDEQFAPDFVALSPNGKIPALLDNDGAEPLAIFESGAILAYLADKYGRFLAPAGHARWKALEWLFWQVSGLAPTLAQMAFFAHFSKEKAPLAIDRFQTEAGRLLDVLEKRLEAQSFLAGDDYTIADIACYPWVAGALSMPGEVFTALIADKPAVNRWLGIIADRPAVARGMAISTSESG